nr:putative reverse transcriptase domain-containing protein [Tanacetum cinerariifolium]GEY40717.1 putative reverse transcriptase domain-containing protein [Tanacetum cinerariifolium]
MVKDIKAHFDMTVRQKSVFECLRTLHAQDFLLAVLIDGLDQSMSPVEYRTILKYRPMIPLFPVDAICLVYRKACLNSFREHAVHCKELSGFKYRHDMIMNVFYICRCVGFSAKKEAPVNFLTYPLDGRFTLRPTDVLVFGWVGGKHACVDLTGVSPLVGLSGMGFTVGQTALKAASCKVTKHEKACIKNQHVFILFAFDTFGFLAPEAVKLLNRVQRVINSNVMTPRSTNVVFHRISFAIQKRLAAQLVARLPFTTINLFPPLDNPELTIQRRSRTDPTFLNNSKMAAEGPGDLPVIDLRTMEELCQPSLNGRGGPIAPIAIQATNFRLKNDMIQQVQNSCQFYGLSGDNANKHLDKFLHVTKSIKVNGVTDDALRLC